jgi:hypothetical protein
MKWKKWKRLLKKDKKKAAEALVKVEYELEGEDPVTFTAEDLAAEIMYLHTGERKPYAAMKRKELLREGKRVFGVEDESGSSSSDAPTEPSGA